jgi:hypothetical protein
VSWNKRGSYPMTISHPILSSRTWGKCHGQWPEPQAPLEGHLVWLSVTDLICLSKYLYCKTLTPRVIVFGYGPLGNATGPWAQGPHDGISSLMKETPESPLPFPQGYNKDMSLQPRGEPTTKPNRTAPWSWRAHNKTQPYGTLILDSQSAELWEINFWFFMLLCDSTLSSDTQKMVGKKRQSGR